MIGLRLNDKPCKCPTSWQEVKTRQYVRILKEWDPELPIEDRDYFKLLSILTDSDFSRMEQTIENQVTLTSVLGWVITQPFTFDTTLPKVMEIDGKLVDIPREPRELSIGQNIHLRRDYIDKSKILEENISIATAIYLQPILDKSHFKMPRAQELAKQIDEMPIALIYPIGFFLLSRALRFGQKPEKNLPPIRTSLKKRLKNLFLRWQKSTS
jgi:hypothetical protein